MQTTTSIKAGNAPDLLSGILSVQVRNEEKITEQDRLYCQSQQDLLYKTLNQIEKWYAIFKEDAEQYRKERKTVQVRGQRQGLHPRLLFPQRAG